MNLVKITDFMSEEMINMNLKGNGKEESLKELSQILSKSENISDVKGCYDDLIAREKLGTTGIGKGVAIPHAKTESASKLTIAFGKSINGVNFEALDQNRVNLFFVFASPVEESKTYLKILARISRLVRNEEFRNKLLKAETAKDVLNLIDLEEKIGDDMKCPYCKAENSKVVDSRNYQDGLAIKRRRECIQCNKRFTTYEKVEQKPLFVIKKNKAREEFQREKVLRGLVRATEKRNIKLETLTDVVDKIEKEAYKNGTQGEIESRKLGEIIMNEIKGLDEVAYVRFASVYKEFNDLKSFIKEIEQINKGEK